MENQSQGQGTPADADATREMTTVLYRVPCECPGCGGTGLVFFGNTGGLCRTCKGSGKSVRLEERQVRRDALRQTASGAAGRPAADALGAGSAPAGDVR